jgi:hypothetical protein
MLGAVSSSVMKIVDISSLAQLATEWLVPWLPVLTKPGEAALQEAAKKAGADAWETAKTLWAKLAPAAAASPALHTAISEVSNAPEDRDAVAAFRLQLRKVLADGELAREMNELLAQRSAPTSQVVAGGGGVAVGGSNFGSIVITSSRQGNRT